jgi:hypothetical protein
LVCSLLRVRSLKWSALKVGMRFRNRKPCVVFGVVLFVSTKVNDAPDDFLWIVASRKGAFGERPVVFGLAKIGT